MNLIIITHRKAPLLHNKKIALFQGQIQTAPGKVCRRTGPQDERFVCPTAYPELFDHRKHPQMRGLPPSALLFAQPRQFVLHIHNVCDLLTRPQKPFFQAQKDSFYR